MADWTPPEAMVEEIGWQICPLLRALDQCDMPQIMDGPHPKCRNCKRNVEPHGGTAGCRIASDLVVRAALAASPIGELVEALDAQEAAVEEHSKCECRLRPEDFLTRMCTPCTGRYLRASGKRTVALARARGET